MAHPLLTYLKSLAYSMPLGVKETSGYPALKALLDEVGAGLKPKVRCIIHPKSAGAGIPDGGLFLADRFKGQPEPDMFGGLNPDRGVIEVKDITADVDEITGGEQVAKYLDRYRQVLVTNYREFRLVGKDSDGHLHTLETYSLADNVTAFQAMLANPAEAARKHGARFVDFLQRVMLRQATLSEPGDVAWLLASYAREALALVEDASALPALDSVRKALSDALGLEFKGDKGEHFFRSTLVQTLFYGLFSAWVLWRNEGHTGRFGWRTAQWEIRVPVLRALFERVASPSNVNTLGLLDVLNAAADALNRVDTMVFFAKFRQEHAVQYFYEPFLAAFDPALRKDLGVWYTPPEIVRYQVARVDTVLKEELGIADGLADPRVYVLDPCCGTGAYLVETLRHVAETLKQSQGDALMAHELKKAARERIFGFEILPAPFVVSHLQIGTLLQTLGAPLEGDDERAGVYLTNALTGWEPAEDKKDERVISPLIELEQEREAAEEVKRERPILVILGNPPYNAFAGVSPAEEKGLVEPYKEGLVKEWGIKKFNLDDLYVRFFRLAERRIAETTGKGVVSFISNYSWLTGPSFVVLRKHLLESFDSFWIENMHGDRKMSEYAPDGRTSETVFAITGMSVGIQQGVAISTWVKSGKSGEKRVLYNDNLTAAKAADRRADLLDSLDEPDFDAQYTRAMPAPSNRFSFRPGDDMSAYLKWPLLTDLCAVAPSNGLMEKRGGALIDIDRNALEERMRLYYEKAVPFESLPGSLHGLMQPHGRFDPRTCRSKILAIERFQMDKLLRYCVRPFDTRWCYYSAVRPLWNEPRPTYWPQCWEGNAFISARPARVSDPEGVPINFVSVIGDNDALKGHAYYFPIQIISLNSFTPTGPQQTLLHLDDHQTPTANMSPQARAYLAALGFPDPDTDKPTAELLWMHALAIGCSPAYLTENADGIRQDWPRIPLPGWPNPPAEVAPLLAASADLGRRVAALLDTERDVPGVTGLVGVRADLQPVGVLKTVGNQADFRVTAGWGHKGQGGVTMPGRGRAEPCMGADGTPALNVYLNATTYWANVPKAVWEYTIGGYQVMKKWLSYREMDILGRPITAEEAREVTNMARRIAALVALREELDENYRAMNDER